jgi:hypothetical protein
VNRHIPIEFQVMGCLCNSLGSRAYFSFLWIVDVAALPEIIVIE